MSTQYPYLLHSYACDPAKSRGRLHPEPESTTRNAFQRDRDRIIHSSAFRRLEYKTQVFVNHEGDHYRTRLTHSLEVAQIARTMSRSLGLCEDLAEALALAHDLGHTPFGHAGEEALDEVMQEYGGFDHNAQTIKILTKLEHRYLDFDGLNLSWETLEGIAKHNGPVTDELPRALKEYQDQHDLVLHQYSSAEAQVAALADDIAYNNHDIDDGLRAGLFAIEDLYSLPLVGKIFEDIENHHATISPQRRVQEAIRQLIGIMVGDLLTQTRSNIANYRIQTIDDIRQLNCAVVEFSPEMQSHHKALKSFLMEHMYRHYKVNRMTSKARRIVRDLFTFFMAEPECLPTEWRHATSPELIGDYIAGMTDRYAIQEHQRLFDLTAGD